jgi:hypothetical protein
MPNARKIWKILASCTDLLPSNCTVWTSTQQTKHANESKYFGLKSREPMTEISQRTRISFKEIRQHDLATGVTLQT